MILIRRILDTLALIGRYGTQGFVASLFVGLALPQLADAARPLLGIATFTFVMMTFMRIDPRALRGPIRHPAPHGARHCAARAPGCAPWQRA